MAHMYRVCVSHPSLNVCPCCCVCVVRGTEQQTHLFELLKVCTQDRNQPEQMKLFKEVDGEPVGANKLKDMLVDAAKKIIKLDEAIEVTKTISNSKSSWSVSG